MSDNTEAGDSPKELETRIDHLRSVSNKQLSDLVHSGKPFPEEFWPKLDFYMLELSERFDVMPLYKVYRKVFDGHTEWRGPIFNAALELCEKAGFEGRYDILKIFWALHVVCFGIQDMCRAVVTMRDKRSHVDLSKQFSEEETLSEHPVTSALQEDLSAAETAGLAIEETTGLHSRSTAVVLALRYTLLSEAVRAWMQARWEETKQLDLERYEQHKQSLEDRSKAVQEANKVQRDIKVGLKAGADNAAIDLQFPASPSLMKDVADHARALMQEQCIPSKLPDFGDSYSRSILRNGRFFQGNTLVCAAYLPSAHTLEVYDMLQPTDPDGFGFLRMTCVFHNVNSLPSFDSIAVQDFCVDPEGLLNACTQGKMGKETLDTTKTMKRHWNGREYAPLKTARSRGELIIEKALRDRKISGGCYNMITDGKLQHKNPHMEGFRVFDACTVVAGMAVHFDSTVNPEVKSDNPAHVNLKWASWQSFDNIKMDQGRPLILGHCHTTAKNCGRADRARKVSVIAAKKSPIWSIRGMWGW